MAKIEDFKIRFQLIDTDTKKVYDYFDMEIPEHVSGVQVSKSEAPFLVAQGLFALMKKRLKK